MSSNSLSRKVLVLAANPQNSSPQQLSREMQDIEEGLRRSQYQNRLVLDQQWAARPRDLRRALQDAQPQIVHFSGSSTGAAGLALETDNGRTQLLGAEALAGLFELFADQVECVLLSACASDAQADAIANHVNYVIGLPQTIERQAALEFSIAFYEALAAGESIDFAYRVGRGAIILAGFSGGAIPVLRKNSSLTAATATGMVEQRSESASTTAFNQPPAVVQRSTTVTTLSTSKSVVDAEPRPSMMAVTALELPKQAPTKSVRIFISYRSQEPDVGLARQFYTSFNAAGHQTFMAGECIRLGENWSQRVDIELEQADYMLLLLSPLSASSEMVTEEVRRAKELCDRRPERKPLILPIRVNFPWNSSLNYDLRGYLNRIQQREWASPDDTAKIVQETLDLIARTGVEISETVIQSDITSEPSLPTIPPLPAPSFSTAASFPPSASEPPPPPPLPAAEPELPGGQVDLASQFYVERPPIEANCYEAIAKPGALIRIKAPRQMGKTSLLSRILQRSRELGHLTVPLSFQLADAAVFTDLDKCLRWFCASIGRRLRLPNRLADYWDDIFGSKDNCTAYFEEYLLAEISSPLTLGLDEVDCVFQHPEIAADFFGLLRAWHEDSKSRDLWKKLRLVVVHSTEVYIPLNINQSPFNVGLPIELSEFTPEQVRYLAQRHGLNWDLTDVHQLMNVVGGHPYLVRVALYYLARKDLMLDQLLYMAPTEAGLYGDHLRRHLWNLEQRPELLEAMKKVITSATPARLESVKAFQLHSMGLVHLYGNEVSLRCNLYREYFCDRLDLKR